MEHLKIFLKELTRQEIEIMAPDSNKLDECFKNFIDILKNLVYYPEVFVYYSSNSMDEFFKTLNAHKETMDYYHLNNP